MKESSEPAPSRPELSIKHDPDPLIQLRTSPGTVGCKEAQQQAEMFICHRLTYQ